MPAAVDLVVVGAGPAGATAALAACRASPGASVLLLDRSEFPRDKPCGDGIAAEVDDELRALGAGEVLAEAPPIPRLELCTPTGRRVEALSPRPNFVVPRRAFDARIVAAAVRAGAELRRHKVRDIEIRADRLVVDATLHARTLVAADGANSTVRRALGIAGNPPAHVGVAVRGYAEDRVGDDTQRIRFVRDGWPAYVWSFPTGTGTLNVGYGLLRHRLVGGREQLHGRLAALLGDRPADAATLRAHHLPLATWRPQPTAGRVLLAGDAASLVNPLTGEGIYYAVVSGRLAGEAAVREPREPARAYRRSLRAALGSHLRHAAVAGRAGRWQPIAEAAVLASASDAAVFAELVELGLARGLLSRRTVAAIAAAAARARMR